MNERSIYILAALAGGSILPHASGDRVNAVSSQSDADCGDDVGDFRRFASGLCQAAIRRYGSHVNIEVAPIAPMDYRY
jgi:hypothetical protein